MIAIFCLSSYYCNFVVLSLDDYVFDLQTVRVWQGSEDGSYNCRHVLKDHTAEVLEAAKRLHLKEHAVCDGSGNIFKLAAPVECKCIVGSDDRHYLLDLMRVTPRVANYTGPGSRFCILRQELVTAFCQVAHAITVVKWFSHLHDFLLKVFSLRRPSARRSKRVQARSSVTHQPIL
ncbi:clustered mitochondria protein homolog [Syzygium oleosum]|uniref:clustered mitochondria protein homolog n=1 Tax=Syzygium oleosum TaxID=219896 RepID=UPI0024B8D0F7|nr:clustered mitochondria protein homolog [Syzygium oleosum]